ncbi:hypothetical protein [Paenibacillus polymyxa]|uniref:hypothetical protein n=1 Tax=Paenibacillus polymyxa TaxID=1406 RepID=UPI0004955ADC|nr:hypothetical protein [Paenibacillus polymyxa]
MADNKKICISCKKSLALSYFYKSYNKFDSDGHLSVCKNCLKISINYDDLNTAKDILMQINRPFIHNLWISSEEESKLKNHDHFGIYMKTLGLPKYRELTWKDSEDQSVSQTKEKNDDINYEHNINEQYNLDQLKDKYGYGYPDEEYTLFENKYQQLKTSFQLLTTMHEEYFREFCVNKVKETLAKAKGNFKEAKEWAAMVKDVAEAGKLKPSQMSKADLSGGLDTFGQLARMVEENYEIMPLLPQFTEQPKDKVDVTLWCFINYVRDLRGLPSCEYKEIYDFYNKKAEDYESQMSDNSLEKDDLNG